MASIAGAQTSYPMISYTTPVAVQRGQSAQVLVEGKMDFFGTYQAMFEGTGVSAEILAPDPKAMKAVVTQVKLNVTTAPDAALGVREFRLISSLGVSSIGQIVVVDDPVVQETKANETLPLAEPIQLSCVVTGRLEKVEDVDFFKFQAEAGQIVTFELWCARLQDKIHDLQKHAKPMLTLHDGDGRELAANDCFYFSDPMLSYTIAKSGAYYIQIRESTYDSDARWVYALLATNKPYISHIYPLAGRPGQMLEVEPIGSARARKERVQLQVPAASGIQQVQLEIDGVRTNPATFIVSTLPQTLEQEPNDEPAQATRIAAPAGINGRIGKQRDLDHFVFAAKKGQPLVFELKARRFGTLLNSTVHGVLDIMDAKGNILASNDTTHGSSEATVAFTAKIDGDHILRVRDLNSKGSDTAVYFVEATIAAPDFTVRCDPDKAMIGPGSSTAWFVHVTRLNGFAGPVQVDVQGLPPGVTASPLTIPAEMTQGAIVLTAASDARLAAANVHVIGKATIKNLDGKDETIVRPVTPNQEIYSPGGGRAIFDVNMHTVAVTEPSDILKVDVSATQIVLKPGQEFKIDVTIQRREDYDKTVSLDIPLRHLGSMFGDPLPPGVSIVAGKSKTLLGKGNQGSFVIKAAANAKPMENVPSCVQAHVSINFVVKVSYSSPPIWVSIAKE